MTKKYRYNMRYVMLDDEKATGAALAPSDLEDPIEIIDIQLKKAAEQGKRIISIDVRKSV